MLRMSVLKMFEALYQRLPPKEALESINLCYAPKFVFLNDFFNDFGNINLYPAHLFVLTTFYVFLSSIYFLINLFLKLFIY